MLPSSGLITMGDIRTELGIPSQAPFSLNIASNGGYVSINPSSPNRPSGADPDSLSEWYGYDNNTGWMNFDVSITDGANLVARLFKNGTIFTSRTTTGTDFFLWEPGDTFQVTLTSRTSSLEAWTLIISSDQRGELYYENKPDGVGGNISSPTFTLQYREQISVIVQGFIP